MRTVSWRCPVHATPPLPRWTSERCSEGRSLREATRFSFRTVDFADSFAVRVLAAGPRKPCRVTPFRIWVGTDRRQPSPPSTHIPEPAGGSTASSRKALVFASQAKQKASSPDPSGKPDDCIYTWD